MLTPLPLFVTGAAAFVLPEASDPQAPIAALQHPEHQDHHDEASSWWNRVVPSVDDIVSAVDDSFDYLTSGVETVVNAVDDLHQEIHDQLAESIQAASGDFTDHTIYQLISACNYTKKFTKLVDEHDDVVKLLNSTSSHNVTLFVPVDSAFKDIPDDHEKPGKEFIEALLQYHVGVGEYSAKSIITTNTIPTALDEKLLGDEAQRIRTSLGLGGLKLNFYSKIVAADLKAKNGIIHGISDILVPPPMVGRILSLFPSEFSTLLHAYDVTKFVDFIHKEKMIGSTVFAPSNRAFASLGTSVNAFLFNTEKGLKYLKALLKYHIAADVTLYSDTVYDKTGDADAEGWKREHFDLKTLLGETHIGVDKATFAGLTIIKVNGFANIVVRDAPAKNGVIHVTDKVLLPPRQHHEEMTFEDLFDEVTIEDLVERLADYVEDDNPSEFEL